MIFVSSDLPPPRSTLQQNMPLQCECGSVVQEFQMTGHLKGAKHKQNMAARALPVPSSASGTASSQTTTSSARTPITIRCNHCQVTLANASAYEHHSTTQTHRDHAKQSAPPPRAAQNTVSIKRCPPYSILPSVSSERAAATKQTTRLRLWRGGSQQEWGGSVGARRR